MNYIHFEQAWQVYLDAKPRLPSFPGIASPQAVETLAEALTHDVDLVVFDAYGVLHEGAEAYPGVAAALDHVRAQGKPLCVVTNDVTHEAGHVAEGLRKRGLDINPAEVISGRDLLPSVVESVMRPGDRVGLHATQPGPLLDRWPGLRLLGNEQADYKGLDGIIFIDTNSWDESHASTFLTALEKAANRAPVRLVVCNPDVGCPFKGRISAEPGYYAHLAAQSGGVDASFMGKPFPAIYQRVLDRFPDIAPSRMLMVGDSPHTDILGARRMGMKCLLITGGFLKGQDVTLLFDQAGLWPDFVAPSIG